MSRYKSETDAFIKRPIDGYNIYSATSPSKDGKTVKHWVKKEFDYDMKKMDEYIKQHPDKKHSIYSEELLFNLFLKDIVLDEFLSSVLLLGRKNGEKKTQKGKILSDTSFVSRLYSLDEESDKIKSDGHDLYNLIEKNGNLSKCGGLLKSIIQRIIFEDWDNRLSNYSDTGAPFDFGFSLGRFKNHSKTWKEDDIRELFEHKCVATALSETIGEFGTRTNNEYYKKPENESKKPKKSYLEEQKKIIKLLKESLLKLDIDPAKALLKVFKEVIEEIDKGQEPAYLKTRKNIKEKIKDPETNNTALGFLDVCNNNLKENLIKFKKIIDGIGSQYLGMRWTKISESDLKKDKGKDVASRS